MKDALAFAGDALALAAILLPWIWIGLAVFSGGRPYPSRLRAFLRWRRRHG